MPEQAAQREPNLDSINLAVARPGGSRAQDMERQLDDDALVT